MCADLQGTIPFRKKKFGVVTPHTVTKMQVARFFQEALATVLLTYLRSTAPQQCHLGLVLHHH
jgi:hypothetical protein